MTRLAVGAKCVFLGASGFESAALRDVGDDARPMNAAAPIPAVQSFRKCLRVNIFTYSSCSCCS